MIAKELASPLKAGRRFLFRLPQGSDIINEITAFCADQDIRCGTVAVIGATSVVTIGYYDQAKKTYEKAIYQEEMEIVSCGGNVSMKDGKPFLHLHAVMSDAKLRCWGGHLFPGSKVFAAEASLQELTGGERRREADAATGLALWCPG